MSVSTVLTAPWASLPTLDLARSASAAKPPSAGPSPGSLTNTPHGGLRLRDHLLLGGLSLALHGSLFFYLLGQAPNDAPIVVPPQTPPMVVELSRPVVETVAPPEPVRKTVAPTPLAPAKTPVPNPPLRQVAESASPTPSPAATALPAANPSPPVAAAPTPGPVEEVVTEPSASAAYLRNPAPEYPAFAQRQGWEGKVLLRVHVLASGRPDSVEIQKSSGRRLLDEAALVAVKGWTFAPAKRGKTAIEGWANVPIEFSLSQ